MRVALAWSAVAPAKRLSGFNPVLSASYPAANRSIYGHIVRYAHAHGITVDFSLTGPAARWAAAGDRPAPENYGVSKPAASAFGQFVEAVATRYSGSYDPISDTIVHGNADDLPRVSVWELCNEPNFGRELAPEPIDGSTVPTSAPAYSSLVDAGWRGLGLTGHGHDTIVIMRPRRSRIEPETEPRAAAGITGQLWRNQAAAVRPHALPRGLDVQRTPRHGSCGGRLPDDSRRLTRVQDRPSRAVPSLGVRRPPVSDQPATDRGELSRPRLHRVLGTAAPSARTRLIGSTALARDFRSATTSTATLRTRQTTAATISSRRRARRPISAGRNTCLGATPGSPQPFHTCCTTRIRPRTFRSSAGLPAG